MKPSVIASMWASVAISVVFVIVAGQDLENEFPDGYFPFEESPSRAPPKVRKPPYVQADVDCPGVNAFDINSLDNLCGDLNKGYIPRSPFGSLVEGHPYPFELIRNKTLDFFSNTLPVLKSDSNLPKVAKFHAGKSGNKKSPNKVQQNRRPVRSINETDVDDTPRQARGFCDHNYGLVCSILKLWNGRNAAAKRIQRPTQIPGQTNSDPKRDNFGEEEPMTPCPSIAEYVTPVFAKNFQGVWRYVVQIPHEGYFTQTVEVTKCLQKKCNFMEGSCLASPRWLSLLVAELYYPHARFPTPKPAVSARANNGANNVPNTPPPAPTPPSLLAPLPGRTGRQSNPTYCDGVDEIGCFQVRLYYDWFLVPGSCKCWKQDFFTKYGKK